MTIIRKVDVAFQDTAALTPFQQLRTAEDGQRLDVEFIYDAQPEIVDSVTSGGATIAHQANARDLLMSIVNTTNATSAAAYTYDVPYTPGNGQKIFITGTLNHANLANGKIFLFLRSTVTGSTVTTLYEQGVDWAPKTAINWQYSQILAMDFQSLKVGRIRFALDRDGVLEDLFEITNDNIRTTGYWQTPSLPAYWRIYNDTTYTYAEMGYGDTLNGIGVMFRVAANASATMRAICATVKSEGGRDLFDIPGFQRSINNANTGITVSTSLVPVLSIRPAATFNSLANRALYIPTEYSFETTQPVRFAILYRPALTNASFAAVNATYSGMEYDVSATAVTGGIVVASGYQPAAGANNRSIQEGLLGRTLLRLTRTATPDILTLAAIRTSTTNAVVSAELAWRELR